MDPDLWAAYVEGVRDVHAAAAEIERLEGEKRLAEDAGEAADGPRGDREGGGR